MSATDAQNMFPFDPNVLVDQYRVKLSEESHRALLLENALTTVIKQRDELQQQNTALHQQVEALSSDDSSGTEPTPPGVEAVDGSFDTASTSD